MNEGIANLVANYSEADLKKAYIASLLMDIKEMEIEESVELAGDIMESGVLEEGEFQESIDRYLEDMDDNEEVEED